MPDFSPSFLLSGLIEFSVPLPSDHPIYILLFFDIVTITNFFFIIHIHHEELHLYISRILRILSLYFSARIVFYLCQLFYNKHAILFTERYKENRQTLNKKESIVETVSNVTISVLTSGITMATVGTLLGVFSTHRLLSQLGYFLGRGTVFSMIAVLFVLPCFLYLSDGICIEKKRKSSLAYDA